MKKVVNGVVLDMTQPEIDELNQENAKWEAGQEQRDHDSIIAQRTSRYRTESDPLYMEWQYDATSETEQTWRDKVAQIKMELPLAIV